MGTSQNPKLFNDYEGFVDKFKRKLTTDDCYTPDEVYRCVVDWVRKRFNIGADREIIRPFWPGGDYEVCHYPAGCVVIDNPPFSIFAQIKNYYLKQGIDFFLFGPHLTMGGSGKGGCRVLANVEIVYDNGAKISTSFLTNLAPGVEVIIDPTLNKALRATQKPKEVKPVLAYDDHITTAALLGMLCDRDVAFELKSEETTFVRACGSKPLFGGGLLMNDQAAERYLSARALALQKKIELERERQMEADRRRLHYSLSPQQKEWIKKH